MLFKLALRCSPLLFVTAAFPHGNAPSPLEVQSFVAVYRVDDTIALIARDAIYDVSMQDGPNKHFYACMNAGLTGAAFQQLALELVQATFSDEQNIQDATMYFSTPSGKKLRDAAIEVLRQRPIRRASAKPLDQPGDYPLTSEDNIQLQQFMRLPAYQDFLRLRRVVSQVGTNPSIQVPLGKLKTKCLSQ